MGREGETLGRMLATWFDGNAGRLAEAVELEVEAVTLERVSGLYVPPEDGDPPRVAVADHLDEELQRRLLLVAIAHYLFDDVAFEAYSYTTPNGDGVVSPMYHAPAQAERVEAFIAGFLWEAGSG